MEKHHILISLACTLMLLSTGIGYFLYSLQGNVQTPDSPMNETHSYDVTWRTTNGVPTHVSEFVSADSEYIKTVSFGFPNLKEIRCTLNWTDDKATVLNRCGLDTLTLQITSPDGTTVQQSATSARRTKQGSVEIIVPLTTERLVPLTLRSRELSEAASQLKTTYDDYTWTNRTFTVRVSVHVGEIRLLKRMADRGNDFDLAITPVFTAPSILEANNFQENTASTNETSEPLKAQIKAGPLEGYSPLTVHFYGNPENDARIVSYNWTFGPTSQPIVPQATFREPRVSVLILFLLLFFKNPLLSFAGISLYLTHLTKTESKYESTERDPTMVFGSTGNYWATLTVTDAQGRTASDTVWITVLQYIYPDHYHTT